MIKPRLNEVEISTNLTIAKLLGITDITKKPDEDVWVGVSGDGVPSVVPLFTRDLNAMDKAYRALTPINRLRYKEALWRICLQGGDQPLSIGNMPIDASPWMRCKAFMKIMGEQVST